MDKVLGEPKIFFSIKFIRASVLNWGTITYTRIISHIHICIHRHYLGIAQIPQIFVVIRPWIRRHRAPKSFWSKKFMRTSILNRRTITYTHTFFSTSNSASRGLFYESRKFINFSYVLAHRSGACSTLNFFWNYANSSFLFYQVREHPKYYFLKTLWGPLYWVGEPSCILKLFFHVHFLIYRPFFRNHANLSTFRMY